MEEFKIRRATLEDKEEILSINFNVYGGLDYLEAFFDDIMTSPLTTPYVATHNGAIIAFSAAYVIDEGDTLISRASRVSPEYSGKGVYKMLWQHYLGNSTAKVNAFTTVNTNAAVKTNSFQRDNRLVVNRLLKRYDFNAHEVSHPEIKSDCGNTIVSVTKSILENLMMSELHKKYLFPKDRIIVNWVPFKLLSSNVPIIWPRGDISAFLSDVVVDDNSAKGLLTISTVIPCKSPSFACMLDIYGTDDSSLRSHLMTHLDYFREHTQGGICLLVFVEPTFSESALKSVFDEFGLIQTDWRAADNSDEIFETQQVFEKSIK